MQLFQWEKAENHWLLELCTSHVSTKDQSLQQPRWQLFFLSACSMKLFPKKKQRTKDHRIDLGTTQKRCFTAPLCSKKDVSINGCTVPPVIIHLPGIFPYKPSSYGGIPIYGNPHMKLSIQTVPHSDPKLLHKHRAPCKSSADWASETAMQPGLGEIEVPPWSTSSDKNESILPSSSGFSD